LPTESKVTPENGPRVLSDGATCRRHRATLCFHWPFEVGVSLKTVPLPFVPPDGVVPYRLPAASRVSAATGPLPFAPLKVSRVFSAANPVPEELRITITAARVLVVCAAQPFADRVCFGHCFTPPNFGFLHNASFTCGTRLCESEISGARNRGDCKQSAHACAVRLRIAIRFTAACPPAREWSSSDRCK